MDRKQNIYERVTERILVELKKGVIPWVQPWQGHAAGSVSRPLRGVGIPYRGINVLMLWAAALDKGYDSPIWLTFKQAKELGGTVRRGEKGSPVVYAGSHTKKQENDEGEEAEETYRFLKGYTVFNVEQVKKLPEHFYERAEPCFSWEKEDRLEKFFAATKAEIQHGGTDKPAYYPKQDYIGLPKLEAFYGFEGYYATIAHEITHWTAHKSRLNREPIASFHTPLSRKEKAQEELVAEIGAAFLCADFGIVPKTIENQAAYIGFWVSRLENDNKEIFRAAARAQKAVDFLVSLQPS